jgi:LPXTG-motif cell wall-anchored protein
MSTTTRIAVGRMFMLVAVAAFALVGGAALAAPVQQGTTQVKIQDFKYDPPALTIAAGTTVTWTNLDTAPHTATSTTSGKFDTGDLKKDQASSITFNEVGTFEYFCVVHPRMIATLTVTAGAAAPVSVSAPTGLPTTGISNSTSLLVGLGLLALVSGLVLTLGTHRRTRVP